MSTNNALYAISKDNARDEFPLWFGQEKETPKEKKDLPRRHQWEIERERLMKRYGIVLIFAFVWAASMMSGCILTGGIGRNKTEKRMEAVYAEMLEAHVQEQAEAKAAEFFLSGEDSLEAAINRATDAVAMVIAKLQTDAQKLTEAACMLARVMSTAYPNSFEEVAEQPQQWMFYDGKDKTFSQHDRELAESIVRPYMEKGIVPNGLTADMVYGHWSQNDFVLRNTWEYGPGTITWRYQ